MTFPLATPGSGQAWKPIILHTEPDVHTRNRNFLGDPVQEELADAAGVHRTYIGMLEQGERQPTIAVSGRIAGALGKRRAWRYRPRSRLRAEIQSA